MRIVLTITYDGKNYCGWQRQNNGITVQQVLEETIQKLTGEKVTVTASGRTDAGVHAIGQIAHFDTNSTIPPERFYLALNTYLPEDIKVIESKVAKEDFHARYSAKKKTYRYNFYFSEVTLPLKDRYAEKCSDTLDFEKMQSACKLFVGEKDFSPFSCLDMSVKTTVRKVYTAKLVKEEDGFYFEICGNGFLYNMVRIIAGAILAVGKGDADISDIEKAFATKERNKRFITLPAKGLTLVFVDYEN